MKPSAANPLADIARLYTDSLLREGATAKGVGWTDPARHTLRFDVLASLLDGEAMPFSVNDLGCGYGALYEYLRGRGFPVDAYLGYDISAAMIEEARARSAGDNVSYVLSSALEHDADYCFASGIFNVRRDCDPDDWLRHVLATLDDLNRHARKGFAFNLLSTYVEWQAEGLYYGDPSFFFHHCRTHYSRFVTLRHDYPLWEWTIIVRR